MDWRFPGMTGTGTGTGMTGTGTGTGMTGTGTGMTGKIKTYLYSHL